MSENIATGSKCCVKTCENVYIKGSIVEFYHFPTDRKTRKAWCDGVKLNVKEITSKHVICDAHFPENMFSLNVRKELNDWAVPNLEPLEPQDPLENCGYDTIEDVEVEDNSNTEIYLEIQCVNNTEYSCDICNKQFATRNERNDHIDGHFKTYTCTTCAETFVGDRQFEHHRLSNKCVSKSKIDSTTYECFMCHKASFFSLRSLRIHFNRTHQPQKQKDNTNVCKFCKKVFSNKYILKSHVNQIHLEVERFTCKECGKLFNRESNLKWHELIHQNELPCACKICGKSFRTLSGLNLHKRTHTGEKPYKCDICNDKSYAYNTDLKRHKRSAHNIINKTFPCPICEQIFYEPKFLRRHTEKVHN